MLLKAKTENLLEREPEKGFLLYDLLIGKAFNLNETLAVVYKAYNGATSFEKL